MFRRCNQIVTPAIGIDFQPDRLPRDEPDSLNAAILNVDRQFVGHGGSG